MPDYSDKPGYFQGYWLEQKPGRESGIWYRSWYDRSSRQVRRHSTGERDFQAAQRALVKWVLDNERIHNAPLVGKQIDVFAGGERLAHIGIVPDSLSAIIVTPAEGRETNPLRYLDGPNYASFEDAMADIRDRIPTAEFMDG